MKPTTKKILALALVCAIPVGIFAYDKYEDRDRHYDRDDNRKSLSYHRDDKHDRYDDMYELEDDDLGLTYELLEKTGINLVFEGKVEQKPKTGFNGIWTISGKDVVVDDSTKIFMEQNLTVADEVEVLAKRENGKIKAVIIEQD